MDGRGALPGAALRRDDLRERRREHRAWHVQRCKYSGYPGWVPINPYHRCGGSVPFDVQCLVLQQWIKLDGVPFAPISAGPPRKRRISGPYLLPEDAGGEPEPINITEYDQSSVWIEARAIINQHRPEMLESIQKHNSQKRSYESISAAEKYAAAVVQHPDKLSRIPVFDAYMQEVLSTGGGGGGEGNGSSDANMQ